MTGSVPAAAAAAAAADGQDGQDDRWKIGQVGQGSRQKAISTYQYTHTHTHTHMHTHAHTDTHRRTDTCAGISNDKLAAMQTLEANLSPLASNAILERCVWLEGVPECAKLPLM